MCAACEQRHTARVLLLHRSPYHFRENVREARKQPRAQEQPVSPCTPAGAEPIRRVCEEGTGRWMLASWDTHAAAPCAAATHPQPYVLSFLEREWANWVGRVWEVEGDLCRCCVETELNRRCMCSPLGAACQPLHTPAVCRNPAFCVRGVEGRQRISALWYTRYGVGLNRGAMAYLLAQRRVAHHLRSPRWCAPRVLFEAARLCERRARTCVWCAINWLWRRSTGAGADPPSWVVG